MDAPADAPASGGTTTPAPGPSSSATQIELSEGSPTAAVSRTPGSSVMALNKMLDANGDTVAQTSFGVNAGANPLSVAYLDASGAIVARASAPRGPDDPQGAYPTSGTLIVYSNLGKA